MGAETQERAAIDFRRVGEHSSEWIVVFDADGRYSYVNPKVEQVAGRFREQILGRSLEEIAANAENSVYEQNCRRALSERTALEFEAHDPLINDVVRVRCFPEPDGGLLVFARSIDERMPPDTETDVAKSAGVLVDSTRVLEAEARSQRSEDQFRALFDSMAQGVLYRDAATQIVVSANAAAERILGVSLAQMQGRALADPEWCGVREDGTPLPLEEYPSSVALTTGQPVRGYVHGLFNPRLQQTRWLRIDAVPEYHPGEDKPFRVYSLFEDITEQWNLQREQERLYAEAHARAEREALLSDASRLLNASLDYKETLTTVASMIVPRFADWCAVDIVDETGEPQRVAVEHVDPEKAAWGWELHRRYPTRADEDRGIAAVLRTGKASFVPHVTDEMLTAAIPDEERLRLMIQIGFTSVMIVPLAIRENVFGVLSLIATRESGRIFTEEDLRFAEEIGQRAALAVENARLFQALQVAEIRQRRIADTLQESMLLVPPAEDAFPGLQIDSHYEAAWDDALIGGDYGDAFRVGENLVAILVGDCTGKGLEAARFVAECEFMARTFLRENPHDPAEALRRINAMLIQGQRLDSRPESALTTLAVAIIDTITGNTLVSAGGAEPPILVRAATGRAEEVPITGMLLGMSPEAQFECVSVSLFPGDHLFLTTDGTTEARNRHTRKFFGFEGVAQAVEQILRESRLREGAARKVVARARQFSAGALADDACVVIARFSGQQRDPGESVNLQPNAIG